MKSRYLASFVMVCAALTAGAQTTVLNDSFSSDSLNPGSYVNPTSTSTTWETIANKTTVTSSLSSGLNLGTASTGSVVEAAALFTTSPITLAASGDYVRLTFTFSGTGIATSNGYVLTGLFNSHGTTPLTGLTNYTSATFSGGTAGWTGYNVGMAVVSGSSSTKMFARPTQTALTANNQDLIYGGLGSAYTLPVQIGTSNSTKPSLTDSTVYTATFDVSLNSSLASVTTYNLYTGASATGTPILTGTGTQASGTATTIFDSFALGFYNKASASSAINYSSVSVSTNVALAPVPEPATYALLAGLATLGFVAVRRSRARTA
ncbi:MAG: PEP-CTERM sorting domain-containing protein [Verrucomicrobia bacterium]|nr:PEP-CTERM sorting domain-containing protein [Verrucomicrobiota bacterium]